MNIIFIVPYVPNRIRVRSYNLIKELSSRGHRVTVLTIWRGDQERQDVEHLNGIVAEVKAVPLPIVRSIWNCLKALPSRTPLQAVYCWQPSLARILNDLIASANDRRGYDLVHVEHLRGIHYGLSLKAELSSRGHSIPIVWDSVDCISLLFRQAAQRSKKAFSRWMTRLELSRTERYEGRLVGELDHVLVTSAADRDTLRFLVPKGQTASAISVLSNGVDLEYFSPNGDQPRKHATLVMSGKMSYHANISMVLHFVQNILPQIWENRPEVELWIVGKNPPRELLALSDDRLITVTGMVPDIRPYLWQATLAVAPLTYGAGVQNKVLEAMACATPVVSSPRAVAALDANPGEDVLVASDPASFAKAVLSLVNDPQRQIQVGAAGRRYVEGNHNWERIVTQLEGIYRELINKQR